MRYPLKTALADLARPPLQALGVLAAPLSRLWAFIRLAARLDYTPHSSNVVLGLPEIHGSGNIALGRDNYLYRDLYWETQGNGRIALGDGVVLSRGVHLVARHAITIGDGTMIGEYSSVRDADHVFGTDQALRQAGHCSAAISIGDQVWIGRGVTVLSGVSIGDGAVIGANAVVTRDIPAGAVAVGVPARPLPQGDLRVQCN